MVNAQQLFIICWLILLQMFDFGMLQVLLTSLVWKQQIKLARPNSSYKLVSVLWCQDIFNFFVTNSTLTHSFLMHTFSTAWKHQKTWRFSNVFRGVEKECIRNKWVKWCRSKLKDSNALLIMLVLVMLVLILVLRLVLFFFFWDSDWRLSREPTTKI